MCSRNSSRGSPKLSAIQIFSRLTSGRTTARIVLEAVTGLETIGESYLRDIADDLETATSAFVSGKWQMSQKTHQTGDDLNPLMFGLLGNPVQSLPDRFAKAIEIATELFPGEVQIDERQDPEVPDLRYVVVTVRAFGDQSVAEDGHDRAATALG